MIIRDLIAQIRFTAETAPIDKADRKVDSLKQTLGGLKTAAVGAFAALGGAKVLSELSEAVDASLAYGEALGKIQSIVQDNAPRMREYKNAISDMALSTGRSVGELAEAAYQVVSTFGDTSETFAQLTAATQIGIAGNATAAEGIKLLSAVTKSYGDTSAAAQKHVSDLAFQTVNLGIIEIPELTANIGQVTPVANALGVSLEELFAVVASTSGVTGSGAEVMTQMSSAMTALLKKTPAMEHAFHKLHIKTAKQLVATYGLVGGFKKLVGTTDGTQEGMEKLFGRVEGLKLMLQLTGAGAGDFDDKLKAMGESAGATDAAVRNMTTGYGANAFAAKKAEQRTAALRVEVGERLEGAANSAKTAVQDFAGAIAVNLFDALALSADPLDAQANKFDKIRENAEIATDAVLAFATAIDAAVSVARVVGAEGKLLGLGAWRLSRGDLSGAGQAWDEGNADIKDIGKGFARRASAAGEHMLEPEQFRNRAELKRIAEITKEDQLHAMQVRAEYNPQIRKALESGEVSKAGLMIQQMNIKLEVPEGTPQQQREALARAIPRLTEQALRRAHADVTLKTDKGVVDTWGAEGTNSTFD